MIVHSVVYDVQLLSVCLSVTRVDNEWFFFFQVLVLSLYMLYRSYTRSPKVSLGKQTFGDGWNGFLQARSEPTLQQYESTKAKFSFGKLQCLLNIIV